MHHRRETPKLDTSAEHNHPIDSTHNPTQGRSPSEEHRRASAGEISLSETDIAWFSPIPLAGGSHAGAETAASPTPNPSSSTPGFIIGCNRRNSSYGSVSAHSGGPVGSTGMFNAISKCYNTSTVGVQVISGGETETEKRVKRKRSEEEEK
ncbi:hypothetical protein TWF281_001291 [Arthrobotrys megalospora]